MARLALAPYKHSSLFNSETFEQPYQEEAVCPCPHYLDSIETVMQIANTMPVSFDYEAESLSDKLSRWDTVLDAAILGDNVVSEDIEMLENHFEVFEV